MSAADTAIVRADEGHVRPEDPNVRQRRASNPERSVWVGASACHSTLPVLRLPAWRFMAASISAAVTAIPDSSSER